MEAKAGEAVSLEGDLNAFFAEHDRCGEWDNILPEDGSRVVMTCSCGATFSRMVEQTEGQEKDR